MSQETKMTKEKIGYKTYKLLNETFSELASLDDESIKDIDELLQKIVNASRAVLNADLIEFYEYNQNRNKFNVPQFKSGDYIDPSVRKKEVLQDDVMYALIDRKEPLYIEKPDDVPKLFKKEYTVSRNDAPEKRFFVREKLESVAVVPIRAGDENVGLMFVNYRRPINFNDDLKELINLFASQTAITIKNARLYQDLYQRREALIAVGKNLTSHIRKTDDEYIYNLIYTESKEKLGMNNLSLALYDNAKDEIQFKFAHFDGKKIEIGKVDSLKNRKGKQGKTGWVIENNRCLYIPSYKKLQSQSFTSKFYEVEKTRGYSWLGVPMRLANMVVGVIATHNYHYDNAFTNYDIETLQALSDIAVIAIHNYDLYTHLDEKAKKLSSEIEEDRKLLKTVIDHIPDHVYQKDKDSKFVLANKTVIEEFGKNSLNEVRGKTDFDFHLKQYAEKYFSDEQGIIRGEREPIINQNEKIINPETGKIRRLLTTKIPFKNEKGETIGVVGVNRDITEGYRSYSLIRIAEAAYTSSTLYIFYEEVHKIINELLPAKNLYIGLYDEINDKINFPYFADEKNSEEDKRKYDISVDLARYVIKKNKHVIASSEELNELETEGIIKRATNKARYWMGVPLKTEKTIGLIVVQTYDENIIYEEEDAKILEFVSHSIASAIENHLKEAQNKVAQAKAIEKITSSIIEGGEIDRIIVGILNMVKELIVDAKHCDILIYDYNRDILSMKWGDAGEPKKYELKMGEGITGWVAKEREIYLCNDVTKDRQYRILYEETKSELAVPIIKGDHLFGVLNIEHDQPNTFNEEDVKLAQAIANLAAVALNNKMMIDERETFKELAENLSRIV